MKLSVSLPHEDVDFLDHYRQEHGGSRSSALHEAVTLLRAARLGADYADAWAEWEADGDASVWEATTADGMGGEEGGARAHEHARGQARDVPA
jgi:Arc/MetJ-type ribon-helix-helix transcriptional regulator